LLNVEDIDAIITIPHLTEDAWNIIIKAYTEDGILCLTDDA
jgi:hypothetical protein